MPHQNFKERGGFTFSVHMHAEDEPCTPPMRAGIRSTRKMDAAEEERLAALIGDGRFLETHWDSTDCDPKRGTYPYSGEWFE